MWPCSGIPPVPANGQSFRETELAAGVWGAASILDVIIPRILRRHSEPRVRGGLTQFSCWAPVFLLIEHRLSNLR